MELTFGRLLPSGTELIPLFPYLKAGLFKRGGGHSVGIRPGNRALVSDHRPTGFLTKSQPRPEGIFLVPSNLPSDQAVVIQQLFIG